MPPVLFVSCNRFLIRPKSKETTSDQSPRRHRSVKKLEGGPGLCCFAENPKNMYTKKKYHNIHSHFNSIFRLIIENGIKVEYLISDNLTSKLCNHFNEVDV